MHISVALLLCSLLPLARAFHHLPAGVPRSSAAARTMSTAAAVPRALVTGTRREPPSAHGAAGQRATMPLMGSRAKRGVLSPVVEAARSFLGKEALNKLRGKVIKSHSAAISRFVETSSTPVGQVSLAALFAAADRDGNGSLDRDEVRAALKALGFCDGECTAQADGVIKRADLDESLTIDFEEFAKAAPATLRTNLIKLAKRNGDSLGLLS